MEKLNLFRKKLENLYYQKLQFLRQTLKYFHWRGALGIFLGKDLKNVPKKMWPQHFFLYLTVPAAWCWISAKRTEPNFY